MVCCLCRSLYGLKQSSRAWFGRCLQNVIQQFGMIQSDVDYSLCIYLIVYVDDIVITCSDKEDIVQLKQYLPPKFQTKKILNT